MKIASVGPNTIVEALDPERTEPPAKTESVSAPHAAQFDTDSPMAEHEKKVASNLTSLIEEAKKRAEFRKKKGLVAQKSRTIGAYKKVLEFEDLLGEKGGSIDESS